MTISICYKCGAEKFGALTACTTCMATPNTDDELALSLVLCEHLSTHGQLTHFAYEIKHHLKLSAPPMLLSQAREALKDTQFMAMLRGRGTSERATGDKPSSASQRAPQTPTYASTATPSIMARPLSSTLIHQSPFALLGISIRDDRRRIVEQAEEKSLELEHDACQKARTDLTNPRNRLLAEIAWLPGVSPRKALQLLEGMLRDAMAIRTERGLPRLAHCNLMAAAFDAINANDSADDVAKFILEMADLVEELDTDDVIREINEDRAVSGFPEIRAADQVESEIAERRRYFKTAIKDALDRLPPTTLLDTITYVVDRATDNGEQLAPELIDELVDSYAIEVQGLLEKEAETLQKLMRSVRDAAESGETAVSPLIDKIEKVVRNWDRFAQPIQLSAKARGIDHEPSTQLSYAVRSLAIDLFNEHDMLAMSRRLTSLVQHVFAELPAVAEQAGQDATALNDIDRKRQLAEVQAKKREEEWAREVTFSADVGLIFKDTLSISPDGIVWKDNNYALDAITAVRWGSVRHSVNGIPTGTDYTIAFATRAGSTAISLKKEATYSSFLEALWRAVCIRLIVEMSEALKQGQMLSFGDMVVEDSAITLVKHKMLGANQKVRLQWEDVHVWSANGEFVIGSKNDKKTYGTASYMSHWNTHLLEHLVRAGFAKGLSKLSEFLH